MVLGAAAVELVGEDAFELPAHGVGEDASEGLLVDDRALFAVRHAHALQRDTEPQGDPPRQPMICRR